MYLDTTQQRILNAMLETQSERARAEVVSFRAFWEAEQRAEASAHSRSALASSNARDSLVRWSFRDATDSALSCRIMPRSSAVAHCCTILPSRNVYQRMCVISLRWPTSRCVPVTLQRTTTASPAATISTMLSMMIRESIARMCSSPLSTSARRRRPPKFSASCAQSAAAPCASQRY